MKKNIIFIALAALILTAVAACGPGTPGASHAPVISPAHSRLPENQAPGHEPEVSEPAETLRPDETEWPEGTENPETTHGVSERPTTPTP